MKKSKLVISALFAAALFFGCAQPESSSSGSKNGSNGGGGSGTPGTPGTPGTTIVPPSEFTPPTLPKSQGKDIFSGKTFLYHDSYEWTFKNDGTYDEQHSSCTTSNRYTYDANNKWFYSSPITLDGGANNAMTYAQAYDFFGAMEPEDLLQMVPVGNTTEEKIQFMLSQLSANELAALNLPQNASNTQILEAILNYQTALFLSKYSNVEKYIVSIPYEDEYRLTYYYTEDFRDGYYSGNYTVQDPTAYTSYTLSYHEGTSSGQDGKPYHLHYSWYDSDNNNYDYYFILDSLPTAASGSVTARDIYDSSNTKTITYTRSWDKGITTLTVIFDDKTFTLTNTYNILRVKN